MQIEGRRILITGGAGFIGSHLVERLAPANQIVVLDNLHRNALAQTNFLERYGVELIVGDVMDLASVRRAVQGCHLIIHMASIAGVDTVLKHPSKTMRVALYGTSNLLEAAMEVGTVERFVDFSTSEVFGRYAFNVNEFDTTPLGAVGEARWTYAVAKLATEHLALTYYREHGLPTVSVRPFNIYGPRQVGEGAVHHFIANAVRDQPLQIHNDGAQIRAWCYVEDIVDGLCLVLSRPEAVGHSFNIGNPRSTLTIYNLAREIIRLAGSKSTLDFLRREQIDVELRIPNIDKARERLGFQPRVDLEEGLGRTIAWYRERVVH